MKKFICILSVILVLLTTAVCVATAASTSDYNFTVGAYETNDFASALSKAQESESATIKLNKNASVSNSGLSVAAGKNVTIDLDGNTLTCTATGNYFMTSIKGNLTIKNGNVKVNRGFVVQSNGHLVIDNADLAVVATDGNARPAVKLQNAGNTHLTVNNSHLSTGGPGEALILVEFGTDAVIDITGKSVLEYRGTLTGNAQNCAVIALQKDNTDLVLNVGSEATLIAGAKSDTSYSRANSIVVGQTTGSINVNLEKGATLFVDRDPGSSATHFIYKMTTPTITVNDKGANWKISAAAQKAGTTRLPEFYVEGRELLGWASEDEVLKPATTVSKSNATSDATFKSLTFSKDEFYMHTGASLRTVAGENGIRFTSQLPKSLLDALGDRIKVGTVIAPTKGNPNTYNGEKLDIKATKFQDMGDYAVFRAAVIMPEDKDERTVYGMELSANAYLTIEYSDGSSKTFYTPFSNDNIRSMRTVAENLKAQGYEDEVVRAILKAFEGYVEEKAPAVLVGYCTKDSLYDGPFGDDAGWKAAGMGYIVRTENGKLIVIDGGNTADALDFYNTLLEYCTEGYLEVDYWIFTHPHGDHVNCFIEMANRANIINNMTVKNMVYYFPEDYSDSSVASYKNKLDSIAKKIGANVIVPQKDQVITVDSADIKFYYVPSDYASLTNINQLSLIFSVTIDKKIMFTGDAFEDSLKKVASEYGNALKSDILQMPHHFLCDTGNASFYNAVGAKTLLLPACIAGYNAMHNDWDYMFNLKNILNKSVEASASKV